MGNEIIPSPVFKLPNRDGLAKTSGGIFKLLVIGVAGFAAYVYLLPYLIGIAIGSIEFFVAAAIALFMLWIFTKPQFWRSLNYYSQWIAEKMLSVAIEMNRWQILYNEVDKQEQDLANTKKQTDILRGQLSTNNTDLADNNKVMREAHEAMDILQRKKAAAKTQDEADEIDLEFETETTNFTNAKDFIDSVTPITTSIATIVQLNDKICRKGAVIIANARTTIKMQKKRFEAVTAGSRALESAKLALSGRPDLHADAEKAYDSISKEIGLKIGIIQGGIQITSQILNQNDLHDAAKISLAAKAAEQYNIDDKFNYSDTVTTKAIPIGQISGTGNDYMNFLKK